MNETSAEMTSLIDKLLHREGAIQEQPREPHFKVVIPEPGFCVKLKDEAGNKIFINVCHSSGVPNTKDLTDDELIELLESDDPTGFRVPMSLGESHAEVDKNGQGCTAYDVVINPNFFDKIQSNELFRTFFLTVTFEGIESKYGIALKREWTILKNKKFIGSIVQQNVRTKSKPLIQDVDQELCSDIKKPLITELSTENVEQTVRAVKELKGVQPEYSLVQEPETGHPEYIIAEIKLPLIKTAASLTLDIGEDRLYLTTRSDVYLLDTYLPFTFIQHLTVAQFNRKTKVLTVTLTVKQQSS